MAQISGSTSVGGTITPGDVLSVVINDIRFNNGPVTNSYKVKTGDTTSTIATGLSNAIYANLGTVGTSLYPNYVYYPNAAGSVVTINPYLSYADVTYSKSVTGVPTESLTSSANFNGNSTVTVGGTPTTGDVASLTVENVNLSGGEETVSYTVAGGNTTTDIATGLKNAINASSTLAAIGVTATSSAAIVTIVTAGTTYTTSTSGGATETLSLGTNANGNTTVAVGGKATNGDSVTVVTHNPLLPGGQESVSYTVGASDTLVEVAAGLAANMNGNSDLQGIDVTAKNSDTADLAFSQSFAGNGTLPVAASLANVRATDAVPTTKTNTNSLNVTASPSSTLTWDANGNMTSDGTNAYKWDAENRLIEINYPGVGNSTQCVRDANGRNVKILEYSGGSLTSTKQFVWDLLDMSEERDGSGNITNAYFAYGEIPSGNNRFYCIDALNSVTEMTDSSGAIKAENSYDPWGRLTSKGPETTSMAFAGLYLHRASTLEFAVMRNYSPQLGRWLSADPLGETGDSSNLYAYVGNDPVSYYDFIGLGKQKGSGKGKSGKNNNSKYCFTISCCFAESDACRDRCSAGFVAIEIARLRRGLDFLDGTALQSCRRCCSGKRRNCFSAVSKIGPKKNRKYEKSNFNDCPSGCLPWDKATGDD